MTFEVKNLIVDLVFQTTPELDARLEYQAEALRDTKCMQPLVGRYIDANHVEYMLAALALGKQDFTELFPAMARIAGPDRREVAAAIEQHLELCLHCSLKRAYDLELDVRIEQACKRSNEPFLQLPQEKKGGSSGDQ